MNSFATSVFWREKISRTGPCSTSFPPEMMATSSQMLFTTSISWVMRITVMPVSRLMVLMSSRIASVFAGSRALVASSLRRTFGDSARARAMATLCFWPPERLSGYCLIRSESPTLAMSFAARFTRSSFGTPASSIGSATLPNTVLDSRRLNCWKIMPTERLFLESSLSGRARRSSPSMRTSPEVGLSSTLMSLMRVLLPAPEDPITPKILPLGTRRVTPSTALISRPLGVWYIFETFLSSTIYRSFPASCRKTSFSAIDSPEKR